MMSSRILRVLILLVLATVPARDRAEAACGCTGMTIRYTNSPRTLCSNNNLNFGECAKTRTNGAGPCAAFTYRYDCPVGSNNTSNVENQYGFVVEAQLAVGSTLAECTKGQALQLTITSSLGVADKPVIPYAQPAGDLDIGGYNFRVKATDGATRYPDVGTVNGGRPYYGSDNYSDPASAAHLIQWDAGTRLLKWWDNPDQGKDDPAEQARWQYRFASFVQGTAGQASCLCVFDIDVNWAANAPLPVTGIARQAQSVNCQVQ